MKWGVVARIAFLAGPPSAVWAQERFQGYHRALREAGLDTDERLVFQAGSTIEEGEAAAIQMLEENVAATAVRYFPSSRASVRVSRPSASTSAATRPRCPLILSNLAK